MKKACLMLIACTFMIAIVSIPSALCYPPAGTDIWNPTTATLKLEIIGMFNETLSATGPITVSRGTPYDPGDGHITINTAIVSMNLVGIGVHLGSATIIENPSKTLNGTIRQVSPGTDFGAYSSFDIFIEIQTALSAPLSTLRNDEPVLINTIIYAIPPMGSLYGSLTGPVPLKDMNNNVVGFIIYYSYKIGTGPIPIGGVSVPAGTRGMLTPYTGLMLAITVATVATAVCTKRAKRGKEKQ